MFLDNSRDLNDNACASWPGITDKNAINTVCWLLELDAQVRVSKIEKYFQDVVCNLLSHRTILTIIHNPLEKKKVSVRLVIKIMTDDH